MATESESSNHGFLYFIVGILLVGVVIIGFMMYNGNGGASRTPESAVERSADAVGDAADKVGDAARDATRNTNPDG
jgi:hypothetical protein